MVDPAGKLANRNGKWLESIIADTLVRAGYYELTDDEKRQFIREDGSLSVTDKEKWFVQQINMTRNLYGSKWKLDFFVYHSELFPSGLWIESKWQGSAGSVDEKYVFTVMSLKKLKIPAALVLSGGGTRPGAIKWIKSQCQSGSNLTFYTLDEFHLWMRSHV